MPTLFPLLMWPVFGLLISQPGWAQEESEAKPDTEVSIESTEADIESIERELEGSSEVEEFEGREKIRADDAISLPSDI